MSRFLATILVVAATASAVAAAESKFDPDALAKTVAPYLDDRTLIVAHIDAPRLDAKIVTRAMAKMFGSEVRDFEPVQQRLEALLSGFRKAGGTDLYVVFSLIDLNEGPFFVVPVQGEGTPLIDFFKRSMGHSAEEKIGEAVIFGSKTTLERLKKLKRVDRPELTKAFAAAGDGAAQVCLLPTAVLRRSIEEMMPELPEHLGGGSIKELTRGFHWAAANGEITPTVRMRLAVQAADAESARTLHTALDRIFKALAKHKPFRGLVPNAEEAIPLAVPSISGDRLTLTRDEKELTTLLQPILTPFAPPPRTDATIRLHQILVALGNYEYAHHEFPAAANYDKQSKPLLSWRVHILPYLGEAKLYKEFHLDEPWDSEHNKKLIGRMPNVFLSSENADFAKGGKTTFLAPTGDATMFPEKRGVRIAEVLDGTSNTIFLVDVENSRAVVWTRPEDWHYDPSDPLNGLARRERDRYMVGMVDGSVRFLQKKISKYTMNAIFTRGGGEIAGADF